MHLFRFLPTRRAYIALSHPDFLQMNIAKLGKVSIGGYTVTAIPCPEPPKIENLRGVKGRKAALERGSLPGLTASGAMSNGRQVCAWGFPPKASVECVKDFLERSKIDTLGDKPEIYKVNLMMFSVRKTSRRILPLLEILDSDPVHVWVVSYSSAHSPDTLPA
ncbi:hypothetical protein J3R83DRAFT_4826 [Lanmaoa asiatica]|nr:hypothetical protein J3R83DRAFT_4826 [Lanmaoa asiatica]